LQNTVIRAGVEDFQILADLMKADVFGLEQFEILLDPELSVSDFLLNKIKHKFAIYF
jgi:hypothetical protein